VDAAIHLTAAEIAYCLEEENAVTLTDVLARRTMVRIGPTPPEESVDRAAAVCGRLAGWGDARLQSELEAFRGRLARFAIPGRAVAIGRTQMSERASESMSQHDRRARERASAPSAQRPAKPTERSEGER
jgi:hypothetical protein